MKVLTLLQALLSALGAGGGVESEAALLTPREKAALVVVAGLPAPPGAGGVIVRRLNTGAPRPSRALVFADQEGGDVRAFRSLPPEIAAAEMPSVRAAFAHGRETGRALRRVGVDVDLAPVLDARGGPLGDRHFRRPETGLAFARGLIAGGAGACPKHFPGLGSARRSTDDRVPVRSVLREDELRAFRAAERARVPCVMVGHAIYPRLGRRPASLEPETYRLLRRRGFEGVAITDDLGVLGSENAARSARLAASAGADLLLYLSPRDARAAMEALVPLASRGLLDEHAERVLRLRRSYAG